MPDSPSKQSSPAPGPPRSLHSFFTKLGRNRSSSQYGSLHGLTSPAISTPSSKHETASDKLSSLLGPRADVAPLVDHASRDPFRTSLSAAKTAHMAAAVVKEDEALVWMRRVMQQARLDGQAEGVEIWTANSGLLSMTWSQTLFGGGIDLLKACTLLSNELANDVKIGYLRHMYYEQVRQAFIHSSGVLDETSLQGLVAVLEALTRGGREIFGLEGLIPLLVDIAARLTDLRQNHRLRHIDLRTARTPLLDSAFATPFVRLPPQSLFLSSDPKSSPAALIIACHRFSYAHIPHDVVRQSMARFLFRGLQSLGEHEVSKVLEFIDTVVKFGYVQPANLEDTVKYVARVIGLEDRVLVVDVSPDGDRRMVELGSALSDQANGVMTNLLRSPANQCLKQLRNILSTPRNSKGTASQCPTPLLIGALRALRQAYKDYEAIVGEIQTEDSATSSSEYYPTLLSLGMTVIHQNLLAVLEWKSDDVDSEVLLFLEERFSSRATEKRHFSYDEWEMVISILEKMTWHVRDWEITTGKPWSIENAVTQSSRRLPTHSSKAEAAPAALTTTALATSENSPSSTNLPVLASFSLVINRMLVAQASDTFTGSHLRFFDFLLTVARHLSSSALVSFFNFYHARQLASPGRQDWIIRLKSITSVFFPSTPYSYTREAVRAGRRAASQLLDESYCNAQGDYVNELMEEVIFPLWEGHLRHEQDSTVIQAAFTLMEKCSVDCLPGEDQTPDRIKRFDRLSRLLLELTWLPDKAATASDNDLNTSRAAGGSSPDRQIPRSSSTVTDVGFSAAQLLIKIFYQLINASCTRCSHQGVRFFEHMLQLVSVGASRKGAHQAPSKRARFVILQCLVRLRADQRHRIFSRQLLDYEELARYLGRTVEQEGTETSRGRERGRLKTRRDLSNADDSKSSSLARVSAVSRSRTRAKDSGASPPRLRPPLPTAPLWNYPDVLPFAFPPWPVRSTGSRGIVSFDHVRLQDWTESVALEGGDESMVDSPTSEDSLVVLPVSEYLGVVQDIIQHETDWDIVSFILCTFPNQLANKHFACGPRAARKLQAMCQSLCERLNKDDLGQHVELPPTVRRSDMHAVAYQWLATLIAYRDLFRRDKQNEMVVTFLRGLSKTPNIAKPSIHALTMACYEFEPSMSKYLPEILSALVRIMSTVNMPVHILELVASIGHIKSLYANFTEDDYKKVFAVGVQYLSTHYENLLDDPTSAVVPEDLEKALVHAFGQYVFLLSFYVIALWYAVIPTSERARYTSFVVQRLLRAIESHPKTDAATEVSLDMLARLAYSPSSPFATATKPAVEGTSTSWIIANSILTIDCRPDEALATFTIRRPSGVISRRITIDADELAGNNVLDVLYRNRAAFQVGQASPLDGKPQSTTSSLASDPAFLSLFLPPHQNLEKYGQPLRVQASEQTRRAVNVLDNMPHIDSHKIGVLYMGATQSTEQEILSNVHGSRSYNAFLAGLGDLTRLQGHRGYTGGLDREADFDGKWAYIWSDDIQQMIFHAATLMPTRPEDPQCNYKKRHIGNDYVKIIFNDSPHRPAFDILPGQFNFINIIIEPHTPAGDAWKGEMGIASNTEFFRVSMQQRADMPEMGPLGIFKMISTESLSAFVRELALHANLFAQLFLQSVGVQNKASTSRQKVDYTSTWRNRLDAIRRFHDLVEAGRDAVPPEK